MKRIFMLWIALLMVCTMSAQMRKVQNRPYIDLRPMHFGILIGFNMQDAEIDNIGPQTITLPDGTQEESCTFIPTYYPVEESVSVSPSGVKSNAPVNITVPEAADVTVYTTMGLVVQTLHVEQGTSVMQAPAAKGVYLVTLRMAERTVTERIVVE